MIFNGYSLLKAAPIRGMESTKITRGGVSYGLSEAGYDIRIKQEVRFRNSANIGNYIEIDDESKVGRFCLASSIEEFNMPIYMVGIVHDKSTWARQGLSVFNTVIENGWNGFLTLELVYHGQGELIIPAGSGIAQVVFHQTGCDAQYNGKYQNQENNPVASRFA